MSSEFTVLREAWLTLDEPSEEVREQARARLFEQIALERGEALGRSPEQERSRTGFRLRSRLAISVVLALLLLLTWAALTLAFGWHVVFGSAPRAPHNSRVFKDFNTFDVLAPPEMASGVIPNQTRLVANLGGQRLWVAPTKAGGYCTATVPQGFAGCDRLGTIPLGAGYSASGPLRGDDRVNLRYVSGSVDPRWSDAVEIRFEDGTVIRPQIVWVSAPIAQGFYVQPISSDHRRPGHLLREVVALDPHGNIVARDDGMRPQRAPYSDEPPPSAVIDQATKVAGLQTHFGEAVLWQAPSRFDTSCTWLELDGRFYFAAGFDGCQVRGYSSRWDVELARRGNLVLFYAFGIPSGGSVRLDFADGHHVRLRPDSDGFLLYRVARPASLASGQPTSYTVVAASGKRLSHSEVSLPPLTSAPAQRPVHLPDGQWTLLPRKAIVSKARKLIEFRAAQGARMTAWVIPIRGGGRCYVYEVGSGCDLPGTHASPLGAQIHGGAAFVLLAGEVRGDVATYELRYMDGAVERLHPVEGFIMYKIPSSHYARGHRLEFVIARARDGHVLAREALPVRAPGVYPCEKPVDFGHGVKACP